MLELRKALRPVIGEQRQQADDGVEGVVHGEQHGLHAPELVPGQVEVQHYACREERRVVSYCVAAEEVQEYFLKQDHYFPTNPDLMLDSASCRVNTSAFLFSPDLAVVEGVKERIARLKTNKQRNCSLFELPKWVRYRNARCSVIVNKVFENRWKTTSAVNFNRRTTSIIYLEGIMIDDILWKYS